jgi:hypothetical protein
MEELGISPPDRIVEALQKAIPALVVKLMLYVVTIRIVTNDATPEGLRSMVQRHLTNFPPAAKLVEDMSGGPGGNAHAAVALHDEELTHPILVLRERDIRVNQPKPGVLAIDLEQVRPKERIPKVPIHSEAVLPVDVQILGPHLRQVVLIKLKEARENWPIRPLGNAEGDVGHDGLPWCLTFDMSGVPWTAKPAVNANLHRFS